ncbi:dynamin Dnm1 [Schizosaccharomyces japonicus yFS275]|uniref:Dynamin Dnm1 n=1 Tax=Schizosaccharomyces japonicus (strain yFS275 / FY16936) TaxID=402676 RepID=B6K1C3_SCHJY|nr:dynamin Dnm1 [Schizosaccharomyces japonicus yFS275]EEB07744.1 dynamin Dnm1 [Schizosaccharomyces japonicus yFS275]
MEQLVPLVNQLQDLVYNTIGYDFLDLPSIVVVGSQSCGKSSVLENIVGREFLPRGTGIVTRRPLVLQLINIRKPEPLPEAGSEEKAAKKIDRAFQHSVKQETPSTTSNVQDYAEFLHLPNVKFTDFQRVREEIMNETLRVAGANKGINKLPINLKIHSTRVLNLTLVDLPGLTKLPIGDQPTDIEAQTRSLIMEYISKPNAIILAVSPANVDIVNSDGLKLARSVDPNGKRTLGILTKLDLMDQGTNAMDILSGRVYPLKLGFIPTVNRSQSDIQTHKSLTDALKAETQYFCSHPAYRSIAHRCGTAYLAKSLNALLVSHIRDRLPDIKARLGALTTQTKQQLQNLGCQDFGDKGQKGLILLQAMTKFASSFIASIDGHSTNVAMKELSGGARLFSIFNNVFKNAVIDIDPMSNLSTLDIRTAILNSTGPRATLFVPELAFDILVKPQIKLLGPVCQQCVQLVYEELMKICHTCGEADLARFPKLQARLIEVVSELLQENLKPTIKFVDTLISIQSAYINTSHPDFIGAQGAMSNVLAKRENIARASSVAVADVKAKVNPDAEMDLPSGPNSANAVAEASTNARHAGDCNSDNKNTNTQSVLAPSSPSFPPDAPTTESATRRSFLNYVFGNISPSPTVQSRPPTSMMKRRTESINTFRSEAPAEESLLTITGTAGAGPLTSDLLNQVESLALEKMNEREQLEVELIRELIMSYFNLTRQTLIDQIPKVIMHLMVNASKEAIQNRLVSELYKEELFDSLLIEDENIRNEREKCEKLLSVYKGANKIISSVL